jgi:hypothetical protein
MSNALPTAIPTPFQRASNGVAPHTPIPPSVRWKGPALESRAQRHEEGARGECGAAGNLHKHRKRPAKKEAVAAIADESVSRA